MTDSAARADHRPIPGTIHIVGAGLAGLSAALRLAEKGRTVTLHEATTHAGGRCRSFHDAKLNCLIDNGNHLLMSGNRAAMAYLTDIGAHDRLTWPTNDATARFAFIDRETGERWTLAPNKGVLPFWLFDKTRRVPNTKLRDYLSGLKLLWPAKNATIADCFDEASPLYRRFWEPLAIAAINMAPDEAAARLLRPVLLETFARGAEACQPLIAQHSLADTAIDPAIDRLRALGVDIKFSNRLQRLDLEIGRVRAAIFSEERITFGAGDRLVLAVPPAAAANLLPGLPVPPDGEPIVNVHFGLDQMPDPALLASNSAVGMIGIIGGFAHWVFVRERMASVTISAGRREAALDAGTIAERAWADVAAALNLKGAPVPPFRVIKEHRATFAQSPEGLDKRPGTRTQWANLLLAGDWTDTGLPATIESAIRSGDRAAGTLLDAAEI